MQHSKIISSALHPTKSKISQAANASFSIKMILAVSIIVIAFIAGANSNKPGEKASGYAEFQVPTEGFVPVKVRMNGTTVFLSDECYTVFFDITDDQAYSVARGMEGTIGVRPLTHDILKDIFDNFGIEITNVMIDRYANDIYYATIYMRQDNNLLELDARPSDSIAMSVRTGVPVYFRKSILQERGVYTCQGNR
jgi:bifunctional DNase/RNase